MTQIAFQKYSFLGKFVDFSGVYDSSMQCRFILAMFR